MLEWVKENQFAILFGLCVGVWEALFVYLLLVLTYVVPLPQEEHHAINAVLFGVLFLAGVVIVEGIIRIREAEKANRIS